jgi:K+/H+ antiporter YhaU regulatory subunit KhtT
VAVVVTHRGDRHIFVQDPESDEPHFWLELDDKQSRTLAAVLLGVHGPSTEGASGIAFGDLVVRDMVIPAESKFIGLTVDEFQAKHPGLVVIAAEHDNEVDFDPQPDEKIEPGVLIVAGPEVDVEEVRPDQ